MITLLTILLILLSRFLYKGEDYYFTSASCWMKGDLEDKKQDIENEMHATKKQKSIKIVK